MYIFVLFSGLKNKDDQRTEAHVLLEKQWNIYLKDSCEKHFNTAMKKGTQVVERHCATAVFKAVEFRYMLVNLWTKLEMIHVQLLVFSAIVHNFSLQMEDQMFLSFK